MRRGGTVSGAVSLVMIFAVLCLTVFSVLTLSTAVGESKLAQATAQYTADYYVADAQATAIAAQLGQGSRAQEIDGIAIAYTNDADGQQAIFSVPAGENQALSVILLLQNQSYDILKWELTYSGDWQADQSIAVWDGGAA